MSELEHVMRASPDVEAVVAAVARDFDVAPDRLRLHACEIYAEYADARVRAFVALLVERQLRDRVRRGIAPASAGELPAAEANTGVLAGAAS